MQIYEECQNIKKYCMQIKIYILLRSKMVYGYHLKHVFDLGSTQQYRRSQTPGIV
jgi:hypothetical protein